VNGACRWGAGWLLVGLSSLSAQVPTAVTVADLAALLQPIRTAHGMPALGAAVLRDGQLVALGVDGIRRVGHPESVTVDDRWHLGSCTKAMTATLLARLCERELLGWGTTVADGLPQLAAAMHADAKGITLAQLLQHRAGLPPNPGEPLWSELFRFDGTDTEARLEVARQLLAVAPAAVPGAKFVYSNSGYMLAGAIAERRTGAPWHELMQREVFAPLGITSAGFGMPGTADGTTQPWGHRGGSESAAGRTATVAVFADNPPSLGPAGTVHMTLGDWAKFVALHLGVLPAAGAPLLRPETLRALHTAPPGADYALGWVVCARPWAKGPVLHHNGSNTMWFCVAWLDPAAQFAVLVTCNHGDGAAACDAVAAACIERFATASK
jgi:CubicO group peptidase (beta-lactamase class C family)